MPRESVQFLPVKVSGVGQEAEHVLPAAGGELRVGLAGVVLRRARQQGHLGGNSLEAPPQ